MAHAGGGLAEATITDTVSGDEVRCLFRPKEYSFSKQNNWARGLVKGKNVPQLEFSGGNAATLNMELFFDTYEKGEDVRAQYTNKLWSMMKINEGNVNDKTKKSEPPKVIFRWGAAWSFKAVITQMTQRFTLFLPNGTPVRATVTVAFQQAEDEGSYPFQNPTSHALAGHKLRVVRQGDRLDWIAFEEYGDATAWRHVADANDLADPLNLEPGQVLLVPPL
jgi:nucleoid-associated protein YgaU